MRQRALRQRAKAAGGPLALVVSVTMLGLLAPAADASRRPCGERHIFRITGTIAAEHVSCTAAVEVFDAVERAPLPESVAATPYFHFSRSYTVATPAGRYSCRREPYGLAGSEHTILCVDGRASIRWSTVHD